MRSACQTTRRGGHAPSLCTSPDPVRTQSTLTHSGVGGWRAAGAVRSAAIAKAAASNTLIGVSGAHAPLGARVGACWVRRVFSSGRCSHTAFQRACAHALTPPPPHPHPPHFTPPHSPGRLCSGHTSAWPFPSPAFLPRWLLGISSRVFTLFRVPLDTVGSTVD